MTTHVENKEVLPNKLIVPDMNYGQLNRWKNRKKLKYVLEFSKQEFLQKTSNFFSDFRKFEIEDNDPDDIQVLLEYKNAEYPQLDALISQYQNILKELVKYNDYELLHLLVEYNTPSEYFFSLNSINEVFITDENIILTGICFRVIL